MLTLDPDPNWANILSPEPPFLAGVLTLPDFYCPQAARGILWWAAGHLCGGNPGQPGPGQHQRGQVSFLQQ